MSLFQTFHLCFSTAWHHDRLSLAAIVVLDYSWRFSCLLYLLIITLNFKVFLDHAVLTAEPILLLLQLQFPFYLFLLLLLELS